MDDTGSTINCCVHERPTAAGMYLTGQQACEVAGTIGGADTERIVRRKRSEQREVPCPKFAKLYQALMGDVDRHNQLRLQRYSIQMSNRWMKYYKSLIVGLVDVTIVNAYIIYRENFKQRQLTLTLAHVQFLMERHLPLKVTTADGDGYITSCTRRHFVTGTDTTIPSHDGSCCH
ncbi:unnamed protein product [Phytophthora fragariaefolia]|uniref:Unnamed protein product n=1 Tax=Phytophthora fragariaefolia TaxID=1490495 RepID=A0A9W6WVD5_9STRA|nr:unnamed protein product [Phytophthora fragariaefolia]